MDKFVKILIQELSKHQQELFLEATKELQDRYTQILEEKEKIIEEKQHIIESLYIQCYTKYKELKNG